MPTFKQADSDTTEHHTAKTAAAHRQQKNDPAEKVINGNERLPKRITGIGDKTGKGIDETGDNSRAPHSGE